MWVPHSFACKYVHGVSYAKMLCQQIHDRDLHCLIYFYR